MVPPTGWTIQRDVCRERKHPFAVPCCFERLLHEEDEKTIKEASAFLSDPTAEMTSHGEDLETVMTRKLRDTETIDTLEDAIESTTKCLVNPIHSKNMFHELATAL